MPRGKQGTPPFIQEGTVPQPTPAEITAAEIMALPEIPEHSQAYFLGTNTEYGEDRRRFRGLIIVNKTGERSVGNGIAFKISRYRGETLPSLENGEIRLEIILVTENG